MRRVHLAVTTLTVVIALAPAALAAAPTDSPPPSSSSTPPPPALTTLRTFGVTAGAGLQFAALLGAFSDADPGTIASNYGARITWGDGATSDGKVVASDVSGAFGVVGTHTYAAGGTYPITIVVQAPLDRSLSMVTTAQISASTLPSKPAPTRPHPKTLSIAITRAATVAGHRVAATISCPRSASSCRGYVSASGRDHSFASTLFILPGSTTGTFDLAVPRRLRRAKLTITVVATDPRSGLAAHVSRRIAARP